MLVGTGQLKYSACKKKNVPDFESENEIILLNLQSIRVSHPTFKRVDPRSEDLITEYEIWEV